MSDAMETPITLFKRDSLLFARIGGKEEAVSVVWLRPLTGRGGEIALLGEKEDLATLSSPDALDAASRDLAREELDLHYFSPVILRVVETEASFGTRNWKVETDRGTREFAMKNPFLSIRWVNDDEMIIKDVIGNRFRVPSFKALDAHSRAEIEKVT